MDTALQKNAIMELKGLLGKSQIQEIFLEMLGKRAGAFINSVTNVTRNSESLQKCDPQSIISSAIDAASLNLPVDPGLGFAAIVPYGTKAQFQIMYKGITQLAIRSGQYKTISCSEIYRDELLSYNPITGVVKFKDPANYKLRFKKNDKDVIGHYAEFVLTSGFEKSDYMSHAEAMAHGRKYSKAFQYDERTKKKACPWSTDPISMCNKTVYLRLMKKYAVLSIEMERALGLDKDESFKAAQADADEMVKDQQGSKTVDAEFEPEADNTSTPEKKICPTCNLQYRRKGMRKTTKCCECGVNTQTGEVANPEPPTNAVENKWFCNKCDLKFPEPKLAGNPPNQYNMCPSLPCCSRDIEEIPF